MTLIRLGLDHRLVLEEVWVECQDAGDQFRHRVHAELFRYIAAMDFDSLGTDTEHLGNVLC